MKSNKRTPVEINVNDCLSMSLEEMMKRNTSFDTGRSVKTVEITDCRGSYNLSYEMIRNLAAVRLVVIIAKRKNPQLTLKMLLTDESFYSICHILKIS